MSINKSKFTDLKSLTIFEVQEVVDRVKYLAAKDDRSISSYLRKILRDALQEMGEIPEFSDGQEQK